MELSEEEKKAFDYLYNTTNEFLSCAFCHINSHKMNLYDFRQLETLLNLIEKQQKKIEHLEECYEGRVNLTFKLRENSIDKQVIRDHIKNLENKLDIEDSGLYTLRENLESTINYLKDLIGD